MELRKWLESCSNTCVPIPCRGIFCCHIGGCIYTWSRWSCVEWHSSHGSCWDHSEHCRVESSSMIVSLWGNYMKMLVVQGASTGCIKKASHLTAFCAWEQSPSPSHSSAADDAWYWLKSTLCSAWLCITSRPAFFYPQGCGSLHTVTLLIRDTQWEEHLTNLDISFHPRGVCIRVHGSTINTHD